MLYSRAVEDRFKRLPDTLYFGGLLPLLSWLPPRIGYAAMRWVGRLVARNFPHHERLLIEKLTQHLPGATSSSARRIAHDFYQILVAEDFDAFYYPDWNRESIGSVFTFHGLHHLDRQREQCQGAVLMTGHVGGVSSALVALGVLGYPLTHLAREYPEETSLPAPFYRYALKKVELMEHKLGRPLIYAGAPDNLERRAQTVLEAGRTLREGGVVSIAIDVPPSRVTQSAEARFFGRRCRFPTNFLQIAADCRVPLIPFFTWRDQGSWWRQEIVIQEPIHPSGDLSADLQACVACLERAVLDHPENWFAWDSIDHFVQNE